MLVNFSSSASISDICFEYIFLAFLYTATSGILTSEIFKETTENVPSYSLTISFFTASISISLISSSLVNWVKILSRIFDTISSAQDSYLAFKSESLEISEFFTRFTNSFESHLSSKLNVIEYLNEGLSLNNEE